MQTHVFDEKWFERLHGIQAHIRRRLRTDSYSETKKAFLTAPHTEPEFSYGHLNDERYEEKMARLAELRKDIVRDQETDFVVKELYLRKIEERTAHLRMVRSAFLALKSPDDSGHHAAKFRAASEAAFGAPRQDVFDQLVAAIRMKLSAMPPAVKATPAFARIEEVLRAPARITIPPLQSIEPSLVEAGRVFTDAEEVQKQFEAALDDVGLSNWRVEVNTGKVSSFMVWPSVRKITIPRSGVLRARRPAKELTHRMLKGLLAHEVRTHAVRTERGLASPLRLLSVGLHAYLRGEEGVATYREQLITGADDYASPHAYLAVGLAYGCDGGGKPRTFSQVFAILRDYYAVMFAGTERDIDTMAFLTCMQVFKGIDGGSPLLFTRGVVYREGNIAIHTIMRERPNMRSWFDVGKYDPANAMHVRSLQKLGIIGAG